MNMAIIIRLITVSLTFLSTLEPRINPAIIPGRAIRDSVKIYRVKIPVTIYRVILAIFSMKKIKHTLPLKAVRSFVVRST
jgi:hypothetical protein